MKFIVQNIGGDTFAYFESEDHHRRAEPTRGGTRLDPEKLSIECDLSAYRDCYFVIDVNRKRRKKK